MKLSLKTNDLTSSSRLAFPGYLTIGYRENVTGTGQNILGARIAHHHATKLVIVITKAAPAL